MPEEVSYLLAHWEAYPSAARLMAYDEEQKADALREVSDLELLEEWIGIDGEFWPETVCRAWNRYGQMLAQKRWAD